MKRPQPDPQRVPAGRSVSTPAGPAALGEEGASRPGGPAPTRPPLRAGGDPARRLTDADYQLLLGLRTGIRHFLHWSEQQAHKAGLTGAQHQLLLAVRGHNDPRGPTVSELAEYLFLQHHSVVGLLDRAERAGLVERHCDKADRRVVRVLLSPLGAESLDHLSALHLAELARAGGLSELWRALPSTEE